MVTVYACILTPHLLCTAAIRLLTFSSLQATAKAECASIEHEFSEYRAAQRSTPEAELVRQLADANEQVRRAEAKAEKATAAKQSYKEQVSMFGCTHMAKI